jgi:argininosuccinate lyase
MVQEMSINPARMEEDAERGFATATDLADGLAMEGIPFREAHEIVGRLVALCEEKGCTLSEAPEGESKEISPRLTKERLAGLTAQASVERRRRTGTFADSRREVDGWAEKLG